MTKKVGDRLALFVRLLALAALFTLPAVSAAGQCASPIFPAGQNVNVGMRAGDIAAGDLNGDGRADFVVTNGASTFVSIILGSPTGALVVNQFYVGTAQGRVALGDLNNDGKLDLVTLHGGSVAVRPGNGVGGFGPVSTTPLGGSSTYYVMLLADFNGDTKLDLFLGAESYGASRLLLGDGSGHLGAPAGLVNVLAAFSATAGDFNNDSKVDLAVTSVGGPIYLSLGKGDGQFEQAKEIEAGEQSFITSADLNNDGKLDLVTAGGWQNVFVRLGDGAGGFGAVKTFATGFKTTMTRVADFNGDGKPDLVPAGDKSVGVLVGSGTGSFGKAAVYKLSKYLSGMAVGDFDGDGKPDVGTVNAPAMSITGTPPSSASVLLGAGAGKLSHPTVINGGASPFGIAGADFNADGKIDLAVTNAAESKAAILRGNGVGGFGAPTFYPVDQGPLAVTAGDLNGDGRPDLVTTNRNSYSVSVLLNTGAGFRPRIDIEVPWSSPTQTAVGDFNNDGRADLVVVYAGNDSISLLLGDGAGGFGPPTGHTIPYGGHDVAVNDFNRDGKADLVVGFESGFSFLPGDGMGGFGKSATFDTGGVVQSLAVGDFNGDGRADIAGGSVNGPSLFIFLGNGLGNFTQYPSLTTEPGLTSMTAADFNGDGRADVATTQDGGSFSLYLSKGAGAFAPATTFITGGALPRTLVAADFNADGRPDLAVANQNDTFNDPPPVPQGVSVLLNKCSAPPAAVPSLSVGDVEAPEGDAGTAGASFTVNLSAASNRPVTVSYYTAGREATGGADFQAVKGKLVFAAGELTKTIAVPVVGDTLNEGNESFDLFLVYPLNAQLGRGHARATILDNDPPPTVSVNNVSQPEGSSPAVFNVSLSKASGKTVTVKYATASGTAVAPVDYTARALTTVTFAPGQTTQEVAVAVRADNSDEPDETFKLVLSSPTNATLGAGAGTCTIADDDPPPSITVNNVSVTEPDAGTVAATFTARLSAASGRTVTVKYATGGGATNPAAAGADYTAVPLTTLTFAPGEVAKAVTVQVQGDAVKEANETFFLNLSGATNATIVDAQGLGTILNDD